MKRERVPKVERLNNLRQQFGVKKKRTFEIANGNGERFISAPRRESFVREHREVTKENQ